MQKFGGEVYKKINSCNEVCYKIPQQNSSTIKKTGSIKRDILCML